VAIATTSTIVLLVVVAYVVVNSAGWDRVQATFFSGEVFRQRFAQTLAAFRVNIELFLSSQVLVLVVGLLLAVLRSLPGPVFFPIRAGVTIYIDIMRGVPSILAIFIIGFGIPALKLPGLGPNPFLYGVVTLTFIWSAYVAEVYRAGIDSVHPSQEAAARSLGLTRWQTLRKVILPQAVRRVIPPLLNDFIGLQKDTALVGTVGALEAFNQAQIDASATFNFTSYLAAAVLFVAITIPLARFTDWLIARDRGRRQAQGVHA
jgi:polar amino acid transport system permease protein